jgi:rhamnosyltransferase subunit B
MDLLFVAVGSDGDVLPMCGVARELVARGHRVALAANPRFAPLARRFGVEHVALGAADDYDALVRSPALMDRVRGFGAVARHAVSLLAPVYDVIAAHRPARVLAHPLAFAARAAEARLGVPATTVYLSPAVLPSAHLPPVLAGVPNAAFLPRWYKRSIAWAADRFVIDATLAPPVNAFRASLGLRPVAGVLRDGGEAPIALFPSWYAPRQPDWPRGLTLTDFPLCDDAGDAPPELARFLDENAAPIVITAGTANRYARRFFDAALDAAAQLGRPVVALTRFAEQLPPLGAGARHVRYAPLRALLGRAAALVHHGGIGTSAAALAAGVPQLVMPFAHDQPDNAARLERLGVAESLSPRLFRAGAVARALGRLLTSPDVAAHAGAWSSRLARAGGVRAAADAIERASGHVPLVDAASAALGQPLASRVSA